MSELTEYLKSMFLKMNDNEQMTLDEHMKSININMNIEEDNKQPEPSSLSATTKLNTSNVDRNIIDNNNNIITSETLNKINSSVQINNPDTRSSTSSLNQKENVKFLSEDISKVNHHKIKIDHENESNNQSNEMGQTFNGCENEYEQLKKNNYNSKSIVERKLDCNLIKECDAQRIIDPICPSISDVIKSINLNGEYNSKVNDLEKESVESGIDLASINPLTDELLEPNGNQEQIKLRRSKYTNRMFSNENTISRPIRFRFGSIKEEKKISKKRVSELCEFWKDQLIQKKSDET